MSYATAKIGNYDIDIVYLFAFNQLNFYKLEIISLSNQRQFNDPPARGQRLQVFICPTHNYWLERPPQWHSDSGLICFIQKTLIEIKILNSLIFFFLDILLAARNKVKFKLQLHKSNMGHLLS